MRQGKISCEETCPFRLPAPPLEEAGRCMQYTVNILGNATATFSFLTLLSWWILEWFSGNSARRCRVGFVGFLRDNWILWEGKVVDLKGWGY